MIIHGFGVSLERLKEKDIELVREKRNSQLVSQFMEYRENITPEMQKIWFDSINSINNLYYVIIYENRKVGLINGAKIDWMKMETTSGGIFIWEDDLWQTFVPLMANMVLMDISIFLGLRKSFVKIMNDNKKAILYNKMLGYEVWKEELNGNSKIYVLENDNYRSKTAAVRKYLYKLYGDSFKLDIDDPEAPITQFLLDRISKMSPNDKARMKLTFPKI
jgi:UDP-4-amino-4,6-dideoxy-N-acetyl-beta-L-altrosamine N-acetyltransferase